ncbi:SGNH/GDSL hydrolase family protein [Limnohabitans sp.]|uniref:SGNH/GDSL hydrolase family protein n=1 Tax=Limnohabitans sp. TaxID=1907725 RepID=UPI0037BE5847
MRFLFLVLWGWSLLAWSAEPFTPLRLEPQPLQIRNAGAPDVALVCPRKGPSSVRPLAPPPEPTQIPDEDEVASALQDAPVAIGLQPTRPAPAWPSNPARGWRIAVWGDSHMAAAFFSDQLQRKLAPADAPVSSRFVHAGVGHGGVRGLVRKTCLSGEWAREMAYAHADAASAPGPGMTSLVAKRPGATLALDLRDSQGQARHTRMQLLYHGEGGGYTQLAVSVDGEAETLVSLDPQAGPGALALQTTAPLSTLKIRVVEGAFRFQGIKLSETPAPAALHMDLFAYPGATAAGWVRSDLNYLASWFTDQSYDLALIAFGTNEGNDPRFNETAYRDTLTRALSQFRQVFPQTQCVLIGPGDRGVRVVKSKAAKTSKKQSPQSKRSAKAASSAKLLKYAHIHAQIGQIQAEVAALHACSAWSMQTAMGGVGSAYPWARKNPPLMAPDLLHFTPAGYRELANIFLADFGLNPP